MVENKQMTEAEKYNSLWQSIKGNFVAKRAIEIALVGEHSIVLVGNTHTGKKTLRESILSLYGDDFSIETRLPCPCGGYKDIRMECLCSIQEISSHCRQFLNYDIVVETHRPTFGELQDRNTETLYRALERVRVAREFPSPSPPTDLKLLEAAYKRLPMTAKHYQSALTVASSIARLAGDAKVEPYHLAEAIQYSPANFLK